jgi:hypothetical protein
MPRTSVSFAICAAITVFLLGGVVLYRMSSRQPQHLSWSERAVAAMDRHANTDGVLWGLVVDQGGEPLAGAVVTAEMVGINEDWAGSPGGATNRERRRLVNERTDAHGRFQLQLHGLYLRITDITYPEHAWLYDLNISSEAGYPFGAGRLFEFADHGRAGPYIPVRDAPAVFVMVRNGNQNVHVMPSPGGMLRLSTTTAPDPVPLTPVWPRKPSVAGVVYVPRLGTSFGDGLLPSSEVGPVR